MPILENDESCDRGGKNQRNLHGTIDRADPKPKDGRLI
jgi:hypothetical protein